MHERGVHKPSIHTIQIIVGALMLGVLTFAAVALAGGLAPGPDEVEEAHDKLPIVSLVMAGMAVASTLARFFIPPILVSTQRRRSLDEDEEEQRTNFLGLYQTATIVANALTEGAAFACLVAYIVEGQWWLLAIVAAILAIMAINFPTAGKFENWYRNQRELAEMAR